MKVAIRLSGCKTEALDEPDRPDVPSSGPAEHGLPSRSSFREFPGPANSLGVAPTAPPVAGAVMLGTNSSRQRRCNCG